METIDVTPYLAKDDGGNTKLEVPGLIFSAMPVPDLANFIESAIMRPDGVCILRVPREAITKAGIEMPESARQTRNVGWVLAKGPLAESVDAGDIVSFLPINFQTDEEATRALIVSGSNPETRDTEIGWAIESELERIVPPKE